MVNLLFLLVFDGICQVDGVSGVAIDDHYILTTSASCDEVVFFGDNGAKRRVKAVIEKHLTPDITLLRYEKPEDIVIKTYPIGEMPYRFELKGWNESFLYQFYVSYDNPEIYEDMDGLIAIKNGKCVGIQIGRKRRRAIIWRAK